MMVSDQDLVLHQREEIDRLADQIEREFKAGRNPRIENYLLVFPVPWLAIQLVRRKRTLG